MKSNRLFHLLIRNIALPVIVIIFVLAFLSIYQINKSLNESNQYKNDIITSEIKYLLSYRDIALELLEKNLDIEIEALSNKLLSEYLNKSNDLQHINLFSIRNQMGMDTVNEDIYIINSNGIVINSTFTDDLNLNLFAFGKDHRNYLQSILLNNKFIAERFTIETTSHRLRKYCYQPTANGKYIIEIGTYSKKADEIIKLIQNRLQEISQKDKRIIHVDLIMGSDYPFSFNKEPKFMDIHREIIEDVFNKKQSKSVNLKTKKQHLTCSYYYMPRKNTTLYKNSVIQIITDDTPDTERIKSELFKFTFLFVVSIIILILIISWQAGKISRPIKNLLRATNNLLKNQNEIIFENSGISEINNLSENFAKMSGELNERAQQLIEASLKEQMVEKEAEIAYKIGINESVSSYLHHIGNSLTEMNYYISQINLISKSLEKYPEVFIKIREAHKKALNEPNKLDETFKLLERFEIMLSDKMKSNLKHSLAEILEIKNQMLKSLKEQQRLFAHSNISKEKLISEINISHVLRNILQDFDWQIKQNNINLITQFEDNLVAYNQKQQLIIGLNAVIQNSIEAIEISKKSKRGQLEISASKTWFGKNPFDYRINIKIKDNGIGVSESNLNKIFRAGFSTKKLRSGLNLHNFVNFLNYNKCKIDFDSEGIEKGATISITIGNE